MIDYLTSISYYLVIIGAWLLGGAAHLIGTLYEEYAKTGKRISISQYREDYPYKLELGFIFALIALILMAEIAPMNAAWAAMCGYNGDSIAKKAMNILAKMRGLDK